MTADNEIQTEDDREADTHPRIVELRQQGVRPYIELD